MNREIKFRAWDKSNRKMLEVMGLSHLSKENTEDEPEWMHCTSIQEVATRKFDTGVTFEKPNWRPIAEFELMQFTDRKDKNSREIYEGDIMSDGQQTNVVEYRLDTFELRPMRLSLHVMASRSAVIGNIHENPELLPSAKVASKTNL